MTTTALARRTETAVAVPEPTNPQVTRALPLSVAFAIAACAPAVLAVVSLYVGRTGQGQLLGGLVAVLLLAAGYERVREHRP